MLSFLFPFKSYPVSMSLLLLALRLLFGGLMLWHGLSKIENFETLVVSFPDPLRLGGRLSLFLVVFVEVICSVGVIVGAFFRVALLPLIFSMCVALFVVHRGQAFAYKELAFIFMIIFLLLLLTGAGRYSLDNIIAVRLYEERTAIAKTLVEEATARRQQGSESQVGDEPHQ